MIPAVIASDFHPYLVCRKCTIVPAEAHCSLMLCAVVVDQINVWKSDDRLHLNCASLVGEGEHLGRQLKQNLLGKLLMHPGL